LFWFELRCRPILRRLAQSGFRPHPRALCWNPAEPGCELAHLLSNGGANLESKTVKVRYPLVIRANYACCIFSTTRKWRPACSFLSTEINFNQFQSASSRAHENNCDDAAVDSFAVSNIAGNTSPHLNWGRTGEANLFMFFCRFHGLICGVKILFIGDIVGEPGRKAVQTILPRLRDQHALDFVIANGENSAGGNGITPPIAGELFSAGVDVITSGDHLWDQKTVLDLLYSEPRFLRPLNYPGNVPGRGANIFQVRNLPPVGVMNVQGRVFMPPMDNPFLAAEAEVSQLREQAKIFLWIFTPRRLRKRSPSRVFWMAASAP
jgi:hypothetical protein